MLNEFLRGGKGNEAGETVELSCHSIMAGPGGYDLLNFTVLLMEN